jgi:hypothetical protein
MTMLLSPDCTFPFPFGLLLPIFFLFSLVFSPLDPLPSSLTHHHDTLPPQLSSAHTLSYFPDSYTPLFIRGRPHPSTYRRPPIINIGTHARTLAIDALVEQFLLGPAKEAGGGQIVSLGAGSDTRFWRIRVSKQTASSSLVVCMRPPY